MIKQAVCLTMLVLLAGCRTVGIGDVGSLTSVVSATAKAARPISEEEEYYVGRAVAARIIASYPVLNNHRLTEYVNLVGLTIAFHSDKPYTYGGYHFVILDSEEVNAFASPGGIIFITKGMVHSVKSEDELGAVLAHEVAHINHRDGIASIKQSRWTEAVTIIGTEAAKQYGPQQLSRLVTLFEGSIDDVFKTLVVNGYSKSQEYRADEAALTYLARAGYNPQALKDYLDRIVKQVDVSGRVMLKTHPATTERIDNVGNHMPRKKPDGASVQARAKRFKEYF